MAATDPTPTSPIVAPIPVAEPGYATTEFWLALVANGAALASTVAVDFGVASLNAAQRADITAVAIFAVAAVTAVYALARNLRKAGTTA